MGSARFCEEFKRDAVAQITERGYPVSEVSKRLGVSTHSLWTCNGMVPVACLSLCHLSFESQGAYAAQI